MAPMLIGFLKCVDVDDIVDVLDSDMPESTVRDEMSENTDIELSRDLVVDFETSALSVSLSFW